MWLLSKSKSCACHTLSSWMEDLSWRRKSGSSLWLMSVWGEPAAEAPPFWLATELELLLSLLGPLPGPLAAPIRATMEVGEVVSEEDVEVEDVEWFSSDEVDEEEEDDDEEEEEDEEEELLRRVDEVTEVGGVPAADSSEPGPLLD